MTVTMRDMFLFANRDSHSPDWGDDGATGTGDLLHLWQKASGDYTAQATKFDNFVMGVDPQLLIESCVFSGGPRNNLAARGRGDTHISYNIFQRAGIYNVLCRDFNDSVFAGNIMTASGENSVRAENSNNIQFINDLNYFNGQNTVGRLSHAANRGSGYLVNNSGGYAIGAATVAMDTGVGGIDAGDVISFTGDPNQYIVTASTATSVTLNVGLRQAVADNVAIKSSYTNSEIETRLATHYLDASNVKYRNTRIEDTSSSSIVISGKVCNLQGDIDLNSTGSLGPAASDRTETSYPGLDALISGGDWYGVTGIPAIKHLEGESFIQVIDLRLLVRTGRAIQAIKTIAQFSRGTGEQVFRDVNLELILGRNQNDTGNPRLDEPWTFVGGVNYFTDFVTVDDATYHVPLENWRVTVDGQPCHAFHARPRRAWFSDPINKHDRTVVIETETPVRFAISSVTVPSTGKARYLFSTDLTTSNQGRFFQALEAFGLATSANNGRHRVTARSANSDYLEGDAPGSAAEGAPAGSPYAMYPASGVYPAPAKPAGTRTTYFAKAIGSASNGAGGTYVAKAAITALGGDVASFDLTRTGERVTTLVDGLGLEQIVGTDQTEVLPDASYALKPGDYGKRLIIPASAARAITFGAASSYPADWTATVVLTGAGSLTVTGPTNAANVTTQYSSARFARVGAAILQVT